jgi:hypothetical protein
MATVKYMSRFQNMVGFEPAPGKNGGTAELVVPKADILESCI